MRQFLEVDRDSHLELAKLGYERPESKTIGEFVEDFSRFRYVKRLLNRYEDTGEIKVRLVLNHLILIFNVFEKDIALCLLYNNNQTTLHPALNSFLSFMNQIESDDNLDSYITKELSLI